MEQVRHNATRTCCSPMSGVLNSFTRDMLVWTLIDKTVLPLFVYDHWCSCFLQENLTLKKIMRKEYRKNSTLCVSADLILLCM